MRKYQHYGLRADDKLANTARKILETSGIENFCKDLSSPNEPPVLNAEKISFASKEYALQGYKGATSEVLILGEDAYNYYRKQAKSNEEIHNSHLNEIIPGTDVSWYDYGDTNALGCSHEMWCLLIWARLNGYNEKLTNCHIRNIGELHHVAPMYYNVFGEKLEGDQLLKLCEIYDGSYTITGLNFEENNLEIIPENLSIIYNSRFIQHTVGLTIFRMAKSMLYTAFPEIFAKDFKPHGNAISEILSTIYNGEENAMREIIKLGTLGKYDYDKLVIKKEGSNLFLDESSTNISTITRDYIRIWDICAEQAEKYFNDNKETYTGWTFQSEFEKLNKEQEDFENKLKEQFVREGNEPVHPVNPTTIIRERQSEYLYKRLKEKELSIWIEEALYKTGCDNIFKSIDEGVPLEDVLG